MWREFYPIVSKIYFKRVFWTGAYFVASCGGVTIEQLKTRLGRLRDRSDEKSSI
jgi:putative transposase